MQSYKFGPVGNLDELSGLSSGKCLVQDAAHFLKQMFFASLDLVATLLPDSLVPHFVHTVRWRCTMHW